MRRRVVTEEQLAAFNGLARDEKESFRSFKRAWKDFKWRRNALTRRRPGVSPADVEEAYRHWIAEERRHRDARSRMRRMQRDVGIPLYRNTGPSAVAGTVNREPLNSCK